MAVELIDLATSKNLIGEFALTQTLEENNDIEELTYMYSRVIDRIGLCFLLLVCMQQNSVLDATWLPLRKALLATWSGRVVSS